MAPCALPATTAPQDEAGGEEDEGLPLGQLVALRQDGTTSAAAMKARARALRDAARASGPGKFKRQGKHRPAEMSSKKPVPVLRDTLQGGKRCVGWREELGAGGAGIRVCGAAA